MTNQSIRWQDFSAPDKSGPDLTASPATTTPLRSATEEATTLLLAKARGAARAEGFAEGYAEAESRIDRELEHRLAVLAEAIEAATAETAARRRDAIAFTHQLMSRILRRIAPHVATAELAHDVAANLQEILKAAPQEVLCVDIAEDQIERLSALLRAREIDCNLRPASDLGMTGARIHWQGGFDQINMDATVDAVCTVLLTRLEAEAGGAVS